MTTSQENSLRKLGFKAGTYGDIVLAHLYDSWGYTEVKWNREIESGSLRRVDAEIDVETGRIMETRTIYFYDFQMLLQYAKEFTV